MYRPRFRAPVDRATLARKTGRAVARDDFNRQTIDRLAKRAGMKCSFPDCRMPTSGPAIEATDVTNTGVAAHIHAASPSGARYDDQMTPEGRSDISNGIWLCQTHAKLIDDDEIAYPASRLREWKETAEQMAALEAKGFEIRRAYPFADLERKAPKLIAEMKEDLKKHPLVRQFALIPNRRVMYTPGSPQFRYYLEDHEFLQSIMTIMVHAHAIYDVTSTRVPRYNFTEEFVRYLIGD